VDLVVEHSPMIVVIGMLILVMIILGIVLTYVLANVNNEMHSGILSSTTRWIIAMITGMVVSGAVVIIVFAYNSIRGE